jgi:HEAT repeat protein
VLIETAERALVPLLTAFEKEPADSRAQATYLLALRGDKATALVPLFLEALKDADSDVRKCSEHALCEIGVEAIPGIVQLLSAGDDLERRSSAQILGKLAFELDEVVPALVKALQDHNEGVRADAASALARIGSAADAVPLLSELVRSDEVATVRASAARALGAIRCSPDIAIPALMRAATDGNLGCGWRPLRRWADSVRRLNTPFLCWSI